MRMALIALTFASVVPVLCSQSAGAVVADPAALNSSAAVASSIQKVQFYYGRAWSRHRRVKCYRELVIGPYVCHRIGRGWWL
jgi:hypothetical protein